MVISPSKKTLMKTVSQKLVSKHKNIRKYTFKSKNCNFFTKRVELALITNVIILNEHKSVVKYTTRVAPVM